MEELKEFFDNLNIKSNWVNPDKYGFSRVLEFKIYDITYQIVWFVNESTILIGKHKRAARITFRFVYLNRTYPLIGGNKCIGFAYTRKEKPEAIVEREYPDECFKIPIEM